MRTGRTRALHGRGAAALLVACSALAMQAGLVLPASASAQAGGGFQPEAAAKAAVTARGIDVSSFQHPGGARIYWRSVAKAGYRFAFIKSTEGTYYVNPYFKADAVDAEAAGLLVAAYHFANPANSSGRAQADYAVKHGAYQANGAMLRMILDIEPDPYLSRYCYGLSQGQLVSWIAAFMAEAHRITGLRPVINTQPGWWKTCTGGTADFASDQLWVQDPTTTRTTPVLAKGWTRWAYWQYSITARVPGVTGNTDVNKLAPSLLAVADPGNQAGRPGTKVRVPIRSINAAAGQPLTYRATDLPAGLRIGAANGVISGTLPSQAGKTTVSIVISAAGATPVRWRFTWTVR
jgi:GH25 family lysozyme M1 (1,4-beta-N-acetylmuramidase)